MPDRVHEEELTLALKLAETLHLNVEERARLRNGAVRLSAMVAAIGSVLRPGSYFPRGMTPASDFDGVVIERRRDGEVWTHERHEVSVGRLSPVASTPEPSLEQGVTRYLRALSPAAAAIDGVPVDWDR